MHSVLVQQGVKGGHELAPVLWGDDVGEVHTTRGS